MCLTTIKFDNLHCELQERTKESQDDDEEDEMFDDDDDDEDDDCGGCWVFAQLVGCRSAMSSFYSRHKSFIKVGLLVLLVLLYFVYFIYALSYEFGDEGSVRLLWITCLVVVFMILKMVFRCLLPKVGSMSSFKPITYIRLHHRGINRFVDLLFLNSYR